MNKRTILAAASAAFVTLAFASSAAALSLSEIKATLQAAFNGDTSANTESDYGSTDVSGSVNAETGADIDLTGNSGNGTSGSASGNAGGSVNVDLGGNANATSSGNDSSDTDGTTGSGTASVSGNGVLDIVLVNRSDVESNSVTASSDDASDVQTRADLSGYIAAQIEGDENIDEVQASADNVSVTYRSTARLLGFIPSTIRTTATVDASGDVSVSYPWYSFLYKTDVATDLESSLQARVDAMLDAWVEASGSASGSANAETDGNDTNVDANGEASAEVVAAAEASAEATVEFTAEVQARLIAEMRAAMEDAMNASVNADASANADASVDAE